MLQIKTILFVQDVNGASVTELYNRKAVLMFVPNPEQSAEKCIQENIQRAFSKIMDDVSRTLKVEPTNDILQYFYEKNMIPVIWFDENNMEG